REGTISVMRAVRKGGAVGIPADPEPAPKSGMLVPFLAAQARTSKVVPGQLKGHAAQRVFLHCIRLPDNNGFKVIVEKAPEALYSDDEQEAVTAECDHRELCAPVAQSVHVEYEALQEAPRRREEVVLT